MDDPFEVRVLEQRFIQQILFFINKFMMLGLSARSEGKEGLGETLMPEGQLVPLEKSPSLLCLTLLLSSCITLESSMQTARPVKKDETSYGFAGHLLLEHEKNVLEKRKKNDQSNDFDQSDAHTGLSAHARRGLGYGLDVGGQLSLGQSFLESRYSFFNRERYASALGLKLAFPTFSIDEPSTYWIALSSTHSYEFFDNLALYITPQYSRKLYGDGEFREWLGSSLGLMFGKNRAFIYEWTYQQSVAFPHKSLEDLKIGYISNLNKFEHRYQGPSDSAISARTAFGVGSFLSPAFGLSVLYKLDEEKLYELNVMKGYGALPDLDETKVGFTSLSWIYLGTRLRGPLKDLSWLSKWNSSVKDLRLALARREMRADLDLAKSWHHLDVTRYGLNVGLGAVYSDSDVEWFAVFIPLPFMKAQVRWLDSSLDQEVSETSSGIAKLRRQYADGISFSFFRWQKTW